MKRVLLTGGTGHLGRELAPRLQSAGHIVRIMSRRASHLGEGKGLEWAQASLETGAGLAEAVESASIVLHAASSPVKRQVDVDGTGRLLDHARAAGVEHFVYISIIGIEQIDFPYYKSKLAAERLIESSPVPWSIQRATQFHEFIDRLLLPQRRLPALFVPRNWQFQSVSAGEVAQRLAATVQQGPSGRLPDMGGPELLQAEQLARLWLAAQGWRRPFIQLPVPGGLSKGFSQALNTTQNKPSGTQTWTQWLEWRYGQCDDAQ
jgi:uncharacterized protein YbjT (DUF2867 family)